MASRRRKLQRSQSTLTSISTHSKFNSDSSGTFETTNILSKGDKRSSASTFRRFFDSFRGKNSETNTKLPQYSWKYATWGCKRSKSMADVEQHGRFINFNQSLSEPKDESTKNNFSWSETSGVKIIRSLSDLNQALGRYMSMNNLILSFLL